MSPPPTPPPEFVDFHCDDCGAHYDYPSSFGNPQKTMVCSCGKTLRATNWPD